MSVSTLNQDLNSEICYVVGTKLVLKKSTKKEFTYNPVAVLLMLGMSVKRASASKRVWANIVLTLLLLNPTRQFPASQNMSAIVNLERLTGMSPRSSPSSTTKKRALSNGISLFVKVWKSGVIIHPPVKVSTTLNSASVVTLGTPSSYPLETIDSL